MRVLSLCSGVAGLELGVRLAVPEARVVAYVEKDAYCRQVLAARMKDGWLEEAPLYEDLCEFDGHEWRGRVDLVTAGFPCQPWSQAGSRKGSNDPRWLWPEIVRVVREVGCPFVFLENVPGLLAGGLGLILGDLASLGLNAEWGVLSACAVGAAHMRERVWLLAYSGCLVWQRRLVEALGEAGGSEAAAAEWSECRPVSEGGTETADRVRGPGWWGTEPGVGRMAARAAARMDRLRALGNSAVPVAAMVAFRALAARIGAAP